MRAAWIFASLALLPARAFADDTHYQDYPIGGRAVGLGGAFVALGDDPSGIFFNPAGIVDSTRTSVQISTTLYGLEVADSFFSAVTRVTDLKTVFTELNVIPTSASFITMIGDPGPDGRAEQSYGFGAFVPSYRGINARNVSSIPEGEVFGRCTQLAYQRHLLDRTLYFGGSYAQRIDEVFRVGLSGFVTYRALRDQEETICFNDTINTDRAEFASAQTDLDMGVASLLIAFGLKAELGGGWFFGATVTTPSIHVFDSGSVRVVRNSADPSSGNAAFVLRELRDVPTDSETGTSIRAGVAYIVPQTLTFVADATVQMPTRYKLFDLGPSQEDVRDAITLVSDIDRKLTVNVNAGVEYLLSKSMSISGGAFTNFTSAPDIPGSTGDRFESGVLPHVNAYGGSLVMGFFGEHTLTRAGVTLSYGDGDDVVPRYAGLGALGSTTEWVKVDFKQLFIFFFISSTFRY